MTPEQKEQLPELLRLAALALGQTVVCFDAQRSCLRIGHRNSYRLFRPHFDAKDSRWLECDLLMTVSCGKTVVRVWVGETELLARLADHNNNRQAATCWAVLCVAAEIGRKKETKK